MSPARGQRKGAARVAAGGRRPGHAAGVDGPAPGGENRRARKGPAVNEQDVDLVRRAVAGDGSAFERLHAGHCRHVTAYFLRSGFAEAQAEDLAQDVFVRVFRSLHTFDGGRGTFRQWLAAVARNVARRHWGRRPGPDCFDPDLAEEVLAAPPEGGADREEVAALRACIAALPAELQRVVRLRYVEGRTTRGVAEAAGMPESTVRLRLQEAKALLQRCLRGKGILE